MKLTTPEDWQLGRGNYNSKECENSMNRVTLNSFAKVNLYLDILSTRTDGYHLLEMVNAKISRMMRLPVH